MSGTIFVGTIFVWDHFCLGPKCPGPKCPGPKCPGPFLRDQNVLEPSLILYCKENVTIVCLSQILGEGLITLVMSLLGLGAMRSFEKSKNVARDNLK